MKITAVACLAILLPAPAIAQAVTPAERIAAARAAGFTVQGTRLINGCGTPAENIAFERQDLNADGAAELIVSDTSLCYGNGQAMFAVLRKTNGQWKPVLEAQGVMNVLKTRRGGWADIEIGGPGFGKMPVARWTGAKYEY